MDPGLQEDVARLRRQLDDLVEADDDDLAKYELSWPPMPPGWYWRMRWLASVILRWAESKKLRRRGPWPVRLRQADGIADARPLLFWAVGMTESQVPDICRSIALLQEMLPDSAPVIVTDLAAFAEFSRLRCLVEYLPKLAGVGQPYDVRKARMLARLYRGAPVLPIRALTVGDGEIVGWIRWLREEGELCAESARS